MLSITNSYVGIRSHNYFFMTKLMNKIHFGSSPLLHTFTLVMSLIK